MQRASSLSRFLADISKGVSDMRSVLLGFAASVAAITLSPAPVQAEPTFGTGVTEHHGGDHHWRRDGRDRRDHRRDRDVAVLSSWYESRDFDGNRSFDADRWNDWWHERPWRSTPRWVRDNQRCERRWWSGNGWTC